MNPVLESVTSALPEILRRAKARFRRRLQKNEESCQGYANALRHLAVKCEFTSGLLEKMVRDQFIFGLRSTAMQDQLQFCGELDANLSLDQVISVASAGEAFQIMRFNNQHPLKKNEIQDLIAPYLDENSLLTMPTVLPSYKNKARKELAKPERRNLRKAQWLPQLTEAIYDFADFFEPHGLYFSSSDEIQRFIDEFGEEGSMARSCIECPVFGEGIVQFWGCNDHRRRVESCDGRNASYELGRSYYDIVIKFLQLFGAQVKVLIWKINEYSHESPDTLKSVLSLTPNLRDLWVQRGVYEGEQDRTSSSSSSSSEDTDSWPELPYLNTINFNITDDVEGFYNPISIAGPLILVYGSQLTSLDAKCLALYNCLPYPPRIHLERAIQSSLKNIQDLIIDNSINNIFGLPERVNWSLKRLVFSVNDCFNDCCNNVNVNNILWRLINQSSQSLEELYLNYCCDWNKFLVLFLIPPLQNPTHTSNICKKLRKLVIPSLYLLKVKQVSQLICTRFPNLEHIQLARWGYGNAYNYNKEKVSSDLSKMEADLVFSLDYTFPIDWAQLSAEILVHFWNGLASLKEISVTYSKDSIEGNVIFQQTRKLKHDMVITTLST